MRYFVAREESPTAYTMEAEPLPSYTAAMEVLVRVLKLTESVT